MSNSTALYKSANWTFWRGSGHLPSAVLCCRYSFTLHPDWFRVRAENPRINMLIRKVGLLVRVELGSLTEVRQTTEVMALTPCMPSLRLLESYRKSFVSVAIKLYNSSPCCWEESLATFDFWLLFNIKFFLSIILFMIALLTLLHCTILCCKFIWVILCMIISFRIHIVLSNQRIELIKEVIIAM